MEKKINCKIFKVMKPTFKTKFSHLVLIIAFNDKYSRPQLDILHLSI